MSSPWAEKQTTPSLQATAGCEHLECWEGVGRWPWSEQETALWFSPPSPQLTSSWKQGVLQAEPHPSQDSESCPGQTYCWRILPPHPEALFKRQPPAH